MTAKKKGTKRVRDAGTGRYVPPSEAKKRPKQTVTETDKPRRRKKKKS